MAPFVRTMHPSAWKGNYPKFALRGFYEVRGMNKAGRNVRPFAYTVPIPSAS